jgi:hypothetical protein
MRHPPIQSNGKQWDAEYPRQHSVPRHRDICPLSPPRACPTPADVSVVDFAHDLSPCDVDLLLREFDERLLLPLVEQVTDRLFLGSRRANRHVVVVEESGAQDRARCLFRPAPGSRPAPWDLSRCQTESA